MITILLSVSFLGIISTQASSKKHLEVPNALPSSLPSPGSTKSDCNNVINTCDKVLEAKNKEIDQDKVIINKVNKQNAELGKQVDDKDAKLNSPIRKPFLMMGAGAAISLLTGNPIVIIVGILGGILF